SRGNHAAVRRVWFHSDERGSHLIADRRSARRPRPALQVRATRDRDDAVAFTAETGEVRRVLVHQVDVTVDRSLVDEVRGIRVLIRATRRAAAPVPRLLRHLELTTRRPVQPPTRLRRVTRERKEIRT